MRNILIIGATGGIGKACASILSQNEDVCLYITGKNAEKLSEVKIEVSAKDSFMMDVSEVDTIQKVITEICEKGIHLDGVVYAAGIEGVMPIKSMTEAFFENVMKVNCFGFVEICKAMSKKRVSSDDASIVAISSMASMANYVGEGAYCISKSALESAVKQASKELIRRKIRVNAVLPATTETDMLNNARARIEGFDEIINKEQVMGIIPPEQIAYTVEFLLSERSKYITGACIPVNGGRFI